MRRFSRNIKLKSTRTTGESPFRRFQIDDMKIHNLNGHHHNNIHNNRGGESTTTNATFSMTSSLKKGSFHGLEYYNAANNMSRSTTTAISTNNLNNRINL
jgi:hypothetical protein